MEPVRCGRCRVIIRDDLLADVVYGPVTMPCGCRMHQACAEMIIRDDLTCCCNKVATALLAKQRDGPPLDMGNFSLLRMKAMCELMAAAPPAPPPKKVQSEPKSPLVPPMPILPPAPKPTAPRVPVKESGIDVTRTNAQRLLTSRVPIEKLFSAGIPLSEPEVQKVTLDTFLSNPDMTLDQLAEKLDQHDKWGHMLRLGLSWTHLKNKERFPALGIARYLSPTAAQFLSLFMAKEEISFSYTTPSEKSRTPEYYEQLDKIDKARALPLNRLIQVDYSPAELMVMGVDVMHLVNIMGMSQREAEAAYNRNREQAKLVWGDKISERQLKLRFE